MAANRPTQNRGDLRTATLSPNRRDSHCGVHDGVETRKKDRHNRSHIKQGPLPRLDALIHLFDVVAQGLVNDPRRENAGPVAQHSYRELVRRTWLRLPLDTVLAPLASRL